MNIQKLLLRLYPHAWRDRYEEEFLVVCEEHTLWGFFDGMPKSSMIKKSDEIVKTVKGEEIS